jgi:predicted DsbA family dithiol-disulfide isomerase
MTCPAAVVAAVLTAVPRRVSVEFVADVVCPWCYIGLHRLEQASRQAAAEHGIAVDVTYTPFILRRHLPKAGIDKIEMFAHGGMGGAGARSKFEHIRETAAADGLCLDFESQRAGNSEDAHRLLLWAADKYGTSWLPLMNAMFEQYNCHRGWIGSPQALKAAVQATNTLPLDEAAAVVADSTQYVEEVEKGLARSAQLGTHGVPLVIIDGAAAFPGAVAAAELLQGLRQAAESPRRLCEWCAGYALPHLRALAFACVTLRLTRWRWCATGC